MSESGRQAAIVASFYANQAEMYGMLTAIRARPWRIIRNRRRCAEIQRILTENSRLIGRLPPSGHRQARRGPVC